MTHETAAGMGNGPFGEFGRKMDAHLGGMGSRVEEEARKAISYMNDRVVPEVRREASGALRFAAAQFSRMAEVLERGTGPKATRKKASPTEPGA